MTTLNPSQALIEVEGLSKHYADFVAVNQLQFSIYAGQIVGFLGPNGAGKTTTMRMLTTYLPPTSGTARIHGFDVLDAAHDVRRMIGYLPEIPPLYNEMRVASYLSFVAALKMVPKKERTARLDWVLQVCNLTDRRQQVIGTLSKGYRQRVGIAQALIHDPRVLILDEPTSGLDPNQILEIRELIETLGKERTIILSTHIMQEVTSVCNRVLILHHGTLVYDAPMQQDHGHKYRFRIDRALNILENLKHPTIGAIAQIDKLSYELTLTPNAKIQDALQALWQMNVEIAEFAPIAQNLEQIFIQLTTSDKTQRSN